jgi:hypothetical protein
MGAQDTIKTITANHSPQKAKKYRQERNTIAPACIFLWAFLPMVIIAYPNTVFNIVI